MRAVYPGTFDPLTRGHEDVARRAARLFEHVTIGVAESTRKGTMFSLEERVGLAREVFKDEPKISVVGFNSLLLHFMYEERAQVIVRGVRAVSDFEYEFQMAGMNRNMDPKVEVIFLTPADEFMFVSATIVREIAVHGGDASQFVSPLIWQALKDKRAQTK
jgi:pantetheine-phosphate adenylyltransferase